MYKIGIIVSSHNRREKTLTCLSLLHDNAASAELDISVVLYDDGSTDGTAGAVTENFPRTHVLHGDGNSYWAASMSRAEGFLLALGEDLDYILWLNDDVELDADALTRLLNAAQEDPSAIMVGAVRDPESEEADYGGLQQHSWKPLKFHFVPPRRTKQYVDTFNGNVVLVPAAAARHLGGIDGNYPHALADIDYGLRARAVEIPRILAPGTYGICSPNPAPEWAGIRSAWHAFTGRKGGGNPSALRRVLRKLRPRTWPVHFASIYGSWAPRAMTQVWRSRRRHAVDMKGS